MHMHMHMYMCAGIAAHRKFPEIAIRIALLKAKKVHFIVTGSGLERLFFKLEMCQNSLECIIFSSRGSAPHPAGAAAPWQTLLKSPAPPLDHPDRAQSRAHLVGRPVLRFARMSRAGRARQAGLESKSVLPAIANLYVVERLAVSPRTASCGPEKCVRSGPWLSLWTRSVLGARCRFLYKNACTCMKKGIFLRLPRAEAALAKKLSSRRGRAQRRATFWRPGALDKKML